MTSRNRQQLTIGIAVYTFGFGKSTVKFIYSEFEQAIFELKERFIQFPFTNQEIRERIKEFEECFDSK